MPPDPQPGGQSSRFMDQNEKKCQTLGLDKNDPIRNGINLRNGYFKEEKFNDDILFPIFSTFHL